MAANQPQSFDHYKGTDGYWYIYQGGEWKPWSNNKAQPGETRPPGLGGNRPAVIPPSTAPASPTSPTASATKPVQIYPPAVAAPGSGSLRYPDDVSITGESHYIMFNFKKYKPPFSKAAQTSVTGGATPVQAYNASTNNLESSGAPQILLYMPEGVAASYKANWDGKAFGNVAAGILRAAGVAADNNYLKALSGLSGVAEQTVKNATTILGAKGVAAMTKTITGDSVGIQDIFSSVGGAILNPNVELIFGGHDLRTLQLTFKMVPYNKTEAETIHKIVETFKKSMLPKLNQGQAGDFWGVLNASSTRSAKTATAYGSGFIGVPDLVQISFMRGGVENERVSKYKICSITDFDVNYSPDGVYAVGPDGYPVATEIRINFMETKLVYAEDINNGF